ncbi:hypothetical protein IQ255_15815 [Pleurocapsales cyanobacterium LEGE 10410]|nr:hypothetical protein [Pleurocapsales cyanobacterium LEGE 10410]
MKSFKTATILCLSCLGAIAITSTKPATAQTGYDMWTENNYDTSNCTGYSSCYVDSWGQVTGSNDAYDPGSYYPDTYTWQKQLEW